MQKYNFYFEMEGRNGEKVNKRTKKMVLFIGNSRLAKLEQQTSDRQNSGLSEPNSE
jgi:hypothetical protein